MSTNDKAEAADRLSRSRVRILSAVMIVFAIQQANVSVQPPTRTVELVGLLAWLFMASCLLLILRTGGMLLRNRELRALANDEVTRANRAEAIEWGFFGAMGVAIILSVVAGDPDRAVRGDLPLRHAGAAGPWLKCSPIACAKCARPVAGPRPNWPTGSG